MSDPYKPLRRRKLESEATFFRPFQGEPVRVKEADPAVQVMTDLRQVRAMTIGPSATIDSALDKMIRDGVRLLLVANPRGEVIGVVTAHDIQGDKPVRYLRERGGSREDIHVRDVMTLHDQLDVLPIEAVHQARVGDIVATLRQMDRQHALVTDVDEATGKTAIRGVFSVTQIAKQLGAPG